MADAAPLELRTTLAYAQGGYSVEARIGSEGHVVQLMLDTGSSTLALLPHAWTPDRDALARPTALAQVIAYAGGTWSGPLLHTGVAFGEGRHARRLDDVPVARTNVDTTLFRAADGILGLARRSLDAAHDATALLAPRGLAHTWPWPFAGDEARDHRAFLATLRALPRVGVAPAFDALAAHGIVRDLFALQAGRAVVHAGEDGDRASAARDPRNAGVLVLGGGADCQSLYRGAFADVRLFHDGHYLVRLRSVQVGDEAPIAVPCADDAGNALVDSGTTFLTLPAAVLAQVRAALARRDPALPARMDAAAAALARGEGLPLHEAPLHDWPDLHLALGAPGGGETRLRLTAGQLWPRHALRAGQCLCLLAASPGDFADSALLGLPVFAGRYTVFDRRAGPGRGVVRFAASQGTG